jgi:zinc protease
MALKMTAVAGVAAIALVSPAFGQGQRAATPAAKPAPVADLVKSVDIPYQQFTLKSAPSSSPRARPVSRICSSI